MDRGTDARNLLLGKVIPLRLGYIGVVNRSQEVIYLKRFGRFFILCCMWDDGHKLKLYFTAVEDKYNFVEDLHFFDCSAIFVPFKITHNIYFNFLLPFLTQICIVNANQLIMERCFWFRFHCLEFYTSLFFNVSWSNKSMCLLLSRVKPPSNSHYLHAYLRVFCLVDVA